MRFALVVSLVSLAFIKTRWEPSMYFLSSIKMLVNLNMSNNDSILLMAEKEKSNADQGIFIVIISIIGLIGGLFTFRQHIVLIFFISSSLISPSV